MKDELSKEEWKIRFEKALNKVVEDINNEDLINNFPKTKEELKNIDTLDLMFLCTLLD